MERSGYWLHKWTDETSSFDPHGRWSGGLDCYERDYSMWIPDRIKPDDTVAVNDYIDRQFELSAEVADGLEVIDAADAQATIAALQTQLGDLTVKYKNLVAWYDKQNGTPCEQVRHQQEVEALQARVKELEAIKIPDDAFTYCAYCGEKSPVDEHNEDLSAHIKVCPKHPIRDVEAQLTQRTAECDALKLVNDTHMKTVMKLSHVVEQRTAELEAANKLLYRKNCELGRFETMISDLQAELERVGALVRALPKVEGEITVGTHFNSNYISMGRYGHLEGVTFARKEEAAAYAALLKHRQGMEG